MSLGTEIEVAPTQDDFSGGIRSRVSVLGLSGNRKTPPFVKDAVNVHWRPKRAFAVRDGSRDTSTAALPLKPTSIGKFYNSGGNRVFVGTDDGAGGGKLYRHTATAETEQVLSSFTLTNRAMAFAMANGILVMTQVGAVAPPQFFAVGNPSETWYSLALPKPAAAPTFGSNQAGGSITPTVNYYYRVRWVYLQGASETSPVSVAASVVAASGNYTIRVNIPQPGSPRTDYIGWILERTLQDGDATGPFYRVTQQLAAVTLWNDGAADSSLDYESDETIHGAPPAMDGVIFHKSRLWGWRGVNVYLSQPMANAEESTGLCNWIPDPFTLDCAGDAIVGCVKQGDRLLFGARRSLHVIEGIDIDSFVPRRIYAGIGFAGPRSFISLGPTVYLYAGSGRVFVNAGGDRTTPVWSEELGDQLEQMDPVYDADVVGLNYKGEMALFCHRRKDSTVQRDWIGWDLLEGNAVRFRDPPAIDALSQDGDADFGGAVVLLADPTQRNPNVTTAPSQNPSFATWSDARAAATQVYTQSLDSLGATRWAANGVQVGSSTGNNALTAAICGDGVGGTIVAYLDNRSGARVDLYAQRYDASGAPQWAAGGVVVCNAASILNGPLIGICPDGSNGAVIAWPDARSGVSGGRLYAQRLNSSGAPQWTANGVKVYDSAVTGSGAVFTSPYRPSVVKGSGPTFLVAATTASAVIYQVLDGTGAAVGALGNLVGAVQHRAISTGVGDFFLAYQVSDITIRRISAAGATTWSTNATAGRPSVSSLTAPAIVSDASGGLYVAWGDVATGQLGMRAQRLNSAGVPLFAAGGVPISSTVASGPTLTGINGVPDGANGAVFSWNNASTGDLFAARIGPTGATPWGPGVLVSATTFTTGTFRPALCTDGGGGGIVVYSKANDIFASRVTNAGAVTWTTTVCSAAGVQNFEANCFTDTPESEYSPGATAGYHVWAAFEGHTDFADASGQNGSAIAIEVDGHRQNGGFPQYTKVAQRIEVYVNKGKGKFSITVTGDDGSVAALSLEATAAAVQYNSGAKYNDGSKYATSGQATIFKGLRARGRGLAVTIRGEFTDELEVGGWMLEALALPDRRMS